MTTRGLRPAARRLLLAALSAPLIAACSLDNQTIGTAPTPPNPSGGALFARYFAIGTSIGAGIQSGGINDSTQKQAYPYLLATAMGLTPGVNWHYPALAMPGCPAPYTNTLTGARVGNGAATGCAYRTTASVYPLMNNVGIPSIRAAQVLNLRDLTYPGTDSLKLAQFLTGSVDPIAMVAAGQATFVTLEMGANDVLGAATHGDTTLLTPLANFEASFTAIADSLDHIGAKVAVANVPNVTVIPHFSAGVVFFCLNTGAPGCPVGATPPYNSPTFIVDASCAPSSVGGVGDQMLVGFTATATITQVLAAGGAATLNCGAGTATVNLGAGFTPTGPVLSKPTTTAIATEVGQIDAFIQAQATSRGWAYVDLNGLLAGAVASGDIPPFPNFADPSHLFGSEVPGHPDLISYDGIHPTGAAHVLIADAFVAAINAKFGTSLTAP